MRLKFWMFVHDAAEKLWHWVYYNKIAPKRVPDSGVYNYRYFYRNSTSGEDVLNDETSRTERILSSRVCLELSLESR